MKLKFQKHILEYIRLFFTTIKILINDFCSPKLFLFIFSVQLIFSINIYIYIYRIYGYTWKIRLIIIIFFLIIITIISRPKHRAWAQGRQLMISTLLWLVFCFNLTARAQAQQRHSTPAISFFFIASYSVLYSYREILNACIPMAPGVSVFDWQLRLFCLYISSFDFLCLSFIEYIIIYIFLVLYHSFQSDILNKFWSLVSQRPVLYRTRSQSLNVLIVCLLFWYLFCWASDWNPIVFIPLLLVRGHNETQFRDSVSRLSRQISSKLNSVLFFRYGFELELYEKLEKWFVIQ